MPVSTNLKKDRETFLKILVMDNEGTWNRQKGEIPVREWRDAAPLDIQQKYFGARGFLRWITDEQKEFIRAEIWESLEDSQRLFLNSKRKRPISDRSVFDAMLYSERITHRERPENTEGPSLQAWQEINQHLENALSDVPQK